MQQRVRTEPGTPEERDGRNGVRGRDERAEEVAVHGKQGRQLQADCAHLSCPSQAVTHNPRADDGPEDGEGEDSTEVVHKHLRLQREAGIKDNRRQQHKIKEAALEVEELLLFRQTQDTDSDAHSKAKGHGCTALRKVLQAMRVDAITDGYQHQQGGRQDHGIQRGKLIVHVCILSGGRHCRPPKRVLSSRFKKDPIHCQQP
mmetsp:Transcript_75946/g.235746  ORF Transcript_75946/g.235746 Transcript_75946/m.235746 type:complete len:202 (+) Transcript_75946:872-1477(+)